MNLMVPSKMALMTEYGNTYPGPTSNEHILFSSIALDYDDGFLEPEPRLRLASSSRSATETSDGVFVAVDVATGVAGGVSLVSLTVGVLVRGGALLACLI